MVSGTIAVPENKLEFFKELVKSLNFKDIEVDNSFEIPEGQKELVLNRIESSKPENWLKWDDVKDSFKLD